LLSGLWRRISDENHLVSDIDDDIYGSRPGDVGSELPHNQGRDKALRESLERIQPNSTALLPGKVCMQSGLG